MIRHGSALVFRPPNARISSADRTHARQLMGGLALHEGKLAEMATGEGKTLVATLPCYLNALAGKGTVLVVTANDYLARRDAETMGQVCTVLPVGRIRYHGTPWTYI